MTEPEIGEYRKATPRSLWKMWDGKTWVHLSKDMSDFMDEAARCWPAGADSSPSRGAEESDDRA